MLKGKELEFPPYSLGIFFLWEGKTTFGIFQALELTVWFAFCPHIVESFLHPHSFIL
jgi:hypothetical protein